LCCELVAVASAAAAKTTALAGPLLGLVYTNRAATNILAVKRTDNVLHIIGFNRYEAKTS
jgi:hypothetical protein